MEPSATGFIDLDAVIARVKELYPEIDGAALSWFNPTLNPVNRTVQYSVPRISNLCYLTPGSETVRYDVFETTNEYDLTFYLYASRYPGYTGQITYIIEGPEAPADAVFTVSGSAAAEAMTFEPVEGEAGQWTLTASRAAFDGKEHPVMMQLDGEAVPSGLTVTGREAVDVVVLTLGELTGKLSVSIAEGIESWGIRAFELSELDAVAPGETIALFANLKDGYESLRLTSEPKGLKYTSDGDKVSFTMPSHDINVTLYGVRHYQANYMYNYGDLGAYHSVDVVAGSRIAKPADPSVTGLTFAGWYDNASCEGEPFDFGQKLNSNITLYADWRVNVTVDFGGPKGQAAYISDYRYEEIDGENVEIIDSGLIFPGDESEYARFTYATKRLGDVALEIILPNYDGYDFFGWYLTPDYSGDPVEYELTGGVTFYARWERIAMLTYELNYGEQEESYAVSMEYAGMPLGYIPEDPRASTTNSLAGTARRMAMKPNRSSSRSTLQKAP